MSREPEGAAGPGTAPRRSNLQLRVMSAVVLGVVVLGLTWLGGFPFRLLAVAIGCAVFYEWQAMSAPQGPKAYRLLAALLLGIAMCAVAAGVEAAWMLGFAVLAAALLAAAAPIWGQGMALPLGLLYAALPAAALALLRGGETAGLVAILFLFAVVWATDIFAYFAGRAFGGPKLAPAISPGKTWSGAAGGALAGILAAALIVWGSGAPLGIAAAILLGFALSVVAQAGDLFESALKRRHGVKDSGNLIPGHGGVMDRVDGLVAAAFALFLVGALAGGADAPAHALFQP